jgi:putative hemolysin
LIAANGLFAMAEMAIISARRTRLQQRAEDGHKGAGVALELINSPSAFLSTVQIGITLVGVLAGAFGGATLAEPLAAVIARVPALIPYSEAISVVLVVVVITYLSLVLGELVPKRLALNDPEGIAAVLAAPMRRLAVLVGPLARFLTLSTDFVFRLLRVPSPQGPPVTEDDIRIMIEQGTAAGVFKVAEQSMVAGVFRLGDRRVDAIMTHRTEIEWLDLDEPAGQLAAQIAISPHSWLPAAHGELDRLQGVVRSRDVLAHCLTGQPVDPAAAVQPALFLPEATPALQALERIRAHHQPVALVLDEYGGVQGLVTLADIMAAVVGDTAEGAGVELPAVLQREDGSWVLDGLLPVDELKELLDLDELPDEDSARYQTLGGLIVAGLGRIPAVSDHYDHGGWRFEVVSMERHRVDRVLVHRPEV